MCMRQNTFQKESKECEVRRDRACARAARCMARVNPIGVRAAACIVENDVLAKIRAAAAPMKPKKGAVDGHASVNPGMVKVSPVLRCDRVRSVCYNILHLVTQGREMQQKLRVKRPPHHNLDCVDGGDLSFFLFYPFLVTGLHE